MPSPGHYSAELSIWWAVVSGIIKLRMSFVKVAPRRQSVQSSSRGTKSVEWQSTWNGFLKGDSGFLRENPEHINVEACQKVSQ